MYQQRSRVINFRVSDEELNRLKAATALQGARSMSEYARAVLLGAASGGSASPEGESVVLNRLNVLESDVARLVEVIVDRKTSPKSE